MTIAVILSGSGNWTVPSGVTTVRAHCIGPGGRGRQTSGQRGGGGGGAYTWGDLSVTPGGTVAYSVPGENVAAATTFGTVSADYGRQPTTATGGAGGAAANCTPSGNAFSGGQGGTAGTGAGGAGGGGAAGPNGAGKKGGNKGAASGSGSGGGGGCNGGSSTAGVDTSGSASSNGGHGPLGTGAGVADGGHATANSGGGGAGGAGTGAFGGNGATYPIWTDDSGGPNNGVSVGPGGGAGGGGGGTAGVAGAYGGGGAGGNTLAAAGGGLIVLEYTAAGGAYTLTADGGAIAAAGQPAGILAGRSVAAVSGSIAAAGPTAGLLAARKAQAAAGSVSVAGQDATLTYATLARYISAAGSNSNDGLTPSTPWQTTAHLNGQSLPGGTTVYLRGGDTFGYLELSSRTGVKFTSYGTGRATVSNGNGIAAYGEGDLSGLEIDGIDFVGSGKDVNTAPGIMLYSYVGSSTKWTGVTLRNMVISGFGQTGLLIGSEPGDGSAAGFDGMTIDGVDVSNCDEIGIQIYGRNAPASPGAHTGLTITNCTVDSCDHHGIICNDVDGGLIEDCVVTGCGADFTGGTVGIMAYDANAVVIRANEISGQITPNAGGGNGINLDQNCTNCVAEYNFVHGCEGAGIELYGAATGTWANNTVRYNIVFGNGANDQFNGALTIETDGQQLAGIAVYNNVFSAAVSGRGVIRVVDDRCDGFIANNILIAATGVAMIKAQTLAEGSLTPTGLLFAGNDYHQRAGSFSILWGGSSYASVSAWQAAYSSQEKVGGVDVYSTADPLLVDAAGATAADYKLRPGSPMFDLGLDVEAVFSAANDGGQDYFGRSIPNFAGFNIGADGAAVPLLIAANGAFSLAGQAAGLLFNRKIVADAGSLSLAGQDAALTTQRRVSADAAGLTIAGQPASLILGRKLAADAGSLTLAGQPAALLRTFVLQAASGSLTLAGQDADLTYTPAAGFTLAAAAGALSLQGQPAGLFYGRRPTADAGALNIAGQPAGLLFAARLDAVGGSLTIAGQPATFVRGFALVADAASLSLNVGPAGLLVARRLDAQPGSIVVAGADADFVFTPVGSYTLVASPGALSISGQDADLRVARKMPADAGALTVAGADAALLMSRSLPVAFAQFTLSGPDISFRFNRALPADVGAVAVQGPGAALGASRALSADIAALSLTAGDASLLPGRRMVANSGALTLDGGTANPIAARFLEAGAGALSLAGFDASLISTGAAPEWVRISISGILQTREYLQGGIQIRAPLSAALAARSTLTGDVD